MIQTNRLTEKLVIQQLVLSGNTYNENIETWKTINTIYGSITKQAGKLSTTNINQSYTDTVSFYCRYIDLPKKGLSVLYRGQLYAIVNVTPVQRNSAMVLDLMLYV